MAAVVNARDVALALISPRMITTALPSTITLPFDQVNGATKPSNNADVTVTAVNGGVVVTGGGITLSGGGSIKGGQTAYNTGTGFFLGYSSGYKLSIGDPAGNRLTWDGATLTLRGALTWSDISGTGLPADGADVTVTAINGGLTVTGGGITLSSGGSIKGGQTAYDTGTGFFLGYSSGYKFSIGNSSGNKLTWNGSVLSIVGGISGASSIDITGSAKFGGATTSGVNTYAIVGNEAYAASGGIVGYSSHATLSGIFGSNTGSGPGVLGNSVGTGVGAVTGSSSHASGYGVVGVNQSSGVGVYSVNLFKTGNTGLVANLNAERWNGVTIGAITTGSATATSVLTNKPGGATSNSWLPITDTASGTTYYLQIWQ